MKLCKEMVDAMGGQDSAHYRQFKVGGWAGGRAGGGRRGGGGGGGGGRARDGQLTWQKGGGAPGAASTACCRRAFPPFHPLLPTPGPSPLPADLLLRGLQGDPEKAMLKLQVGWCSAL